MKEFINFVCTDSTEIFFSKLRSAGFNYNLPSFFSLTLTVRGVSLKMKKQNTENVENLFFRKKNAQVPLMTLKCLNWPFDEQGSHRLEKYLNI